MKHAVIILFRSLAACLVLTALAAHSALAQNAIGPVSITGDTGDTFRELLSDTRIQQSLEQILEREPETIAEQIRLTEIPAPPFMEEERAEDYLRQMRNRGLGNARIDGEGNVIGRWQGSGDGPLFVLSAHLDTVFPMDTDVTVQERDGRYHAPGISDDGRGLAVLLTVIETLTQSGIETVGDILFVGTVGEEGRGDLRGVKALFNDHPDIDAFVSIDSSGLSSITHGATGSRRFEVQFSGPGGHSFGAFGMASAIHAMGRAITKIGDLEVPEEPRTTFTVGTVEGGTSVNSIAGDAVFALDMRSNSPDELIALEERVWQAVREAVEEENSRWEQPEQITVEFELIGDRPAGLTAADHPLVQSTALAFDAVDSGVEALRRSSTDSNVPMSLGIPAVTIGGGGRASGAHSLSEWFEPVDSHQGPQAAWLLMLAMVGVEGLTHPLLKD
ncbi:MAG: M20/M25/M40 family metallo-hydrolase [Pseudohongiellaceae bacterium]